ncbi:uncharacterized protein LOC129857286 isoform X1 [Salvelinus fontinalis]|uniref:uncharacterized protein LOC129857286 isoform X1 n=1 Tax=Salvelinus fontinalis TaxID=8038 RepID=UPI002484E435|nr:uncharacterized protein LOC129857286 isoform X1 [Salvelinus fontinalis]
MITDKCCNSTHTKSFHLLQLQVKMYLIVPILVSLLLPKAYSLKCFECTPGESGACTDMETDCPTQCGNTRITSYMGGTKVSDVNMKSCSVPAQCLTASVNFGMTRTMIASKCCNTDLCNSQSIPESTETTPNGKKCFTCTGTDCTSALSCVGDEDRCISTIAPTVSVLPELLWEPPFLEIATDKTTPLLVFSNLLLSHGKQSIQRPHVPPSWEAVLGQPQGGQGQAGGLPGQTGRGFVGGPQAWLCREQAGASH